MNNKELYNRIKHARDWLCEHFNTKDAEYPGLVRETPEGDLETVVAAFVTFTDLDRAIVEPSACGRAMGIPFAYRLAFIGTRMAWIGIHPFYQTELPPLWVEEE
jgi:hypothetical protein